MKYGRYAYKPQIDARVAGRDVNLASAAAALVKKREARVRAAERQQTEVAALVAGPEFAYVLGCYYIVKLSCDCDCYISAVGINGRRVADQSKAHAETFDTARDAAWAAYKWGAGATVERVTP